MLHAVVCVLDADACSTRLARDTRFTCHMRCVDQTVQVIFMRLAHRRRVAAHVSCACDMHADYNIVLQPQLDRVVQLVPDMALLQVSHYMHMLLSRHAT